VLAGNGRTTECLALGHETIQCEVLYGWTELEARDYAIRDNLTATLGTWNVNELTAQLGTTARALALGFDAPTLAELRIDFGSVDIPELRPPTTVEPDPAPPAKPAGKDRYADGKPGALTDVYGTPPFTVLDANRGSWRKRKAAWYELLERGAGRDGDLLIDGGGQALADAKTGALTRTSVFDPVLAELLVRWYSAKGAKVLDPFAGGPERGLVSAALGRDYTGLEIRPEQVEANRRQAAALGVGMEQAHWVEADSAALLDAVDGPNAGREQIIADMVLGCPPYYDLEVYSELEGDISDAPTYQDFLTQYRRIVWHTVDRLREDRFAAWVVGDIRDKRGMLRGFPGDTIRAFEDAGAKLYNEAVLVTLAGTAGLRAGMYMRTGRKLARTHQTVLVFVKGDPKKATAWCGELEPFALGEK